MIPGSSNSAACNGLAADKNEHASGQPRRRCMGGEVGALKSVVVFRRHRHRHMPILLDGLV
ncbi:hypothetical protein DAI22_06g214600 [Oryza sativa Japonica Group]|nr:hypothetical protein DAI22_06g214600 [Oryza sativa Japonica Group]